MSGLDPLAALVAAGALQPSALAAIDLGVAIEILQAQLSVGDLITATVLPAQNGADRLSLLGQTVVASLPPGVDPGESLLLQVTAFAGNAIVVRNLGVVDPQNVPPTVEVTIPQPPPGSPSQATLTTIVSAQNQPAPVAPGAAPAAAAGTGRPQPSVATPLPGGIVPGAVAPPRSIFVAASVRPAVLPEAASPSPPVAQQPAAAASDPAEAAAAGAPPPVPVQSQPPQSTLPPAPDASGAGLTASGEAAILDDLVRNAAPFPLVTPDDAGIDVASGDPQQLGLEARIAATRAASIDLSELVTGVARRGPGDFEPTAAARQVQAQAEVEAELQLPAAPPAAPPPNLVPAARVPGPVHESEVDGDGTATARFPARVPAAAALPATPQAALLTRLGVPILPLTVAAARIIDTAAALLPRAFSRLDAALARIASEGDGNAATARTLLGFVQRLDPANARALPEQLMAYVNNVIDGPEAKLAALVRAFQDDSQTAAAAAQDDASASDTAPAPAAAPPTTVQTFAAQNQTAPPSPAEANAVPAATARVAERSVALTYDMKASIAALAETPPAGAPASLAPALDAALTAMTGVQLNVLNAQNTDPAAITIPLPVFYHEGGRPVQLRISKEAPNGGKLDADNFHIAFVLDTKSLGTVAVDLQTAGRAVNVSVKTQGATAAGRFQSTLGSLRGRLEQLRYRVSSISAGVLPHAARESKPSEPVADAAPARKGAFDRRA